MNGFMRIARLSASFGFLCAVGLQAQNAPAPATVTQKLDTPQARVIVATLQPRTPSISKSGHATDRVLIYLDNGVMTRKEGDQSTTINFKRGDVRWRPASGAYIAENTSDHPIRILEVDLNEHVRVLRIHFEPHEKSPSHQHMLNRVVVYLNDQGAAKADDVRVAGAATHTEENATDQPADRIAVELK